MSGPVRLNAGAATRHRPQRAERLFAVAALVGFALTGCQFPPRNHYSPSALPFPAAEGWAQLPTASMLAEAGIEPTDTFLCRPEMCGDPALVTRIALSAREAGFVDQLAADPARLLSRARPSHTPRRPERRAIGIAPLALGAWRGATVEIGSTVPGARPAHMVLLGRRLASGAELMVTVAPNPEAARRLAGAALW
jgi:hypothetical protein